MIASENIRTGDLIAFIPEEMVLKFDAANEAKAVNLLKENDIYDKLSEKERDVVAMALYLQEQSGDSESKWKEYLDILPTDVSNFPIFYDEDHLEWFKGGETGGYIKQLKKNIEETFRTMASGIHDFRVKYPETEFQRMYKLIDSRKYSLYDGQSSFDALIPVVDLFNQGKTPGIDYAWKEQDGKKGFFMTASRDIEVGE